MKTFVLFNNKGGVGKTTLAFNLGHMLARLGQRTLLLDYDPQCNLTSLSVRDDRSEELWSAAPSLTTTVARCIEPIRRGRGELLPPALEPVADLLWLVPGDLRLSLFEQALAESWGKLGSSDFERPVDVVTSLLRLAERAGAEVRADVGLIDVGPSLGALNRAALLASDFVIVPLAPDRFSLQGLENVGPTLRAWREEWRRHREINPVGIPPTRAFEPIGYIVQQHLARADRPVTAYENWAARIPDHYRTYVTGEPAVGGDLQIEDDPWCLARLKHFASLVPLAQQARKPLFDLKKADGIGGGQIQSVAKAREEFEALAKRLTSHLTAVAGDAADGSRRYMDRASDG